MPRPKLCLLAALVTMSLVTLAEQVSAQATEKNPAITPQPRVVEWWFSRQAQKIAEMSKGEIDLLMVGDSITNNFDGIGAPVWKKYFEPRKAINLGFGGNGIMEQAVGAVIAQVNSRGRVCH